LSYASLFEVSQTCDKQSTGEGVTAPEIVPVSLRVSSQLHRDRSRHAVLIRLFTSASRCLCSVSARMDQPSVKLPVFKIASGALLGTR